MTEQEKASLEEVLDQVDRYWLHDDSLMLKGEDGSISGPWYLHDAVIELLDMTVGRAASRVNDSAQIERMIMAVANKVMRLSEKYSNVMNRDDQKGVDAGRKVLVRIQQHLDKETPDCDGCPEAEVCADRH